MIEARAVLLSVLAVTSGLLSAGAAGIGFLLTPVEAPLWFLLASVALPTGDVLKVVRAKILRRKPQSED